MAQFLKIYQENPNVRLIRQAADTLRQGGVIAYPTDSCYALGCQLGDADAVTRMRKIRGLDDKHHFTLMCRDLSEIAIYAQVNNAQFRLLRNNTPGSYTFILNATKEVPRRLQHPKKKTVGLRIPDHSVALALLEELGEPILSTTLILPNEEWPLIDAEQIRDTLEKQIELVIESTGVGLESTTVIDLTNDDAPELLRLGKGDIAPFGIEID